MKKKGQANAMIMLGVGVIILIVILGVVFTFLRDNALDVQTANNESLVLTSGKANTANDDWAVFTSIQNNSAPFNDIQGQCNRTEATGTVSCNSTVVTSTVLITYEYFPNAYLSAGTSRTLASTIPILLIVIVFLFVAGFVTNKGV